ncbi:DUF4350 domain-containing protein [Chloroflexota bacterium]
MGLRKFLVIFTIAVVILMAAVVWFFPSNDDYRLENPFWNGTSDIDQITPVSMLESLSELPSAPQGSTLILVPYLPFTPDELATLDSFISEGGVLILADDYGFGNQVLEYLGTGGRFSGESLLDPLFNYKNQWFPRIFHLRTEPLTDEVQGLLLNHSTCLLGVADNEVLAKSSSFSFLDQNGNGERDADEAIGPLPVISRLSLAQGQLILVADPSLFINSMEILANNYALIKNIAAINSSQLLIDYSHLPPSNLHETKSILSHIHDFLITPLGTLLLVISVLVLTLSPLWWRKGLGREIRGILFRLRQRAVRLQIKAKRGRLR